MVNRDPKMKEIFMKPPMVAYKSPPNLKNKLIKSKLAPKPSNRPKREKHGMKKCRRSRCETCDFVKEGKFVKASATSTSAPINAEVDCTTENYIYLVNCRKCNLQYVGKSSQMFSTRMGQHRNYVTKKQIEKATGEHFNSRGHRLSDFECTIIEKIYSKDPMYLSVREEFWIRKFNTKYKGLNRNKS